MAHRVFFVSTVTHSAVAVLASTNRFDALRLLKAPSLSKGASPGRLGEVCPSELPRDVAGVVEGWDFLSADWD
jgi:hypothetical protein